MKRMFLTVFMLTAVVAAFSQTGTIREFIGEVELKPAGSSAFVPAKPGDKVFQDTIVSTGFKSTAIIVVGSNTLTVRPLTRLSLSEISSSAGTESLNVNLQAGRIKVEVKPPSGTKANTTVHSPSATASVRGTDFDMDTVSVNVNEGNVSFTGSDGLSATVTGGFSSIINIEGAAVDSNDSAAASVEPPPPPGAGASGEKTISGATVTLTDIEISPDWSKKN